ncbi:MAG: hypothetical protein Q7S10_03530 [bacterium]|nr:hypothetical protein [bacterium]
MVTIKQTEEWEGKVHSSVSGVYISHDRYDAVTILIDGRERDFLYRFIESIEVNAIS